MTTKYLIRDFDISKNIVKLRKRAKMTQDQVAAKLQLMEINISRSHFSLIELGRNNVPISMLVGLRIILNCEYADFFEGLENRFEQ